MLGCEIADLIAASTIEGYFANKLSVRRLIIPGHRLTSFSPAGPPGRKNGLAGSGKDPWLLQTYRNWARSPAILLWDTGGRNHHFSDTRYRLSLTLVPDQWVNGPYVAGKERELPSFCFMAVDLFVTRARPFKKHGGTIG
jgi:hypothetical protein